MKNFTRIAGIAAMMAVIGCLFASCDTPEEKAVKAAQKAAADLLKTLGGTDAAAIQEALKAAGPAALAALANTHASPGGDFSYELIKAEDTGKEYICINKYSGAGGLVVVPAEIEGYPVGLIENNCFSANHTDTSPTWNGYEWREGTKFVEGNGGERITAVVLPDSIRVIGHSAFRACTNLHTINIPADLKAIGAFAFNDCENLYNLTIPDSVSTMRWLSVTMLDVSDTFAGCGKLPLATRQWLKDLGYKSSF